MQIGRMPLEQPGVSVWRFPANKPTNKLILELSIEVIKHEERLADGAINFHWIAGICELSYTCTGRGSMRTWQDPPRCREKFDGKYWLIN